MAAPAESARAPVFAERPTELIVREGLVLGILPLALAGVAGMLGWLPAAYALLGLGVFLAAFFRNPSREIPDDEGTVVAPADGRVVAVGEIERPDGSKALRIGIFLSVFNVHVNRAPVPGRVISIERGGEKYLAAFNRKAETENVRCAMTLETDRGERVGVVQISGLIARRIVCHPAVGEWVRRGDRYGLIRFGSRTDVVLPPGSVITARKGEKLRGGSSVIATLPATADEEESEADAS